MKKEVKEMLLAKGREDLVEIGEINDSGYAGVLPNGNIVSRLQYPEAYPITENSLFRIPKSKKIRSEMDTDYVCVPCGVYFLTEEQLAAEGGAHTAHMAKCGACGTEAAVLHIRHYNWLNHPKYKSNSTKDEKRTETNS